MPVKYYSENKRGYAILLYTKSKTSISKVQLLVNLDSRPRITATQSVLRLYL